MASSVGMWINRGLVFMSDTCASAGVDTFATAREMFKWTVPDARKTTIMTADSLATTQAIIRI